MKPFLFEIQWYEFSTILFACFILRIHALTDVPSFHHFIEIPIQWSIPFWDIEINYIRERIEKEIRWNSAEICEVTEIENFPYKGLKRDTHMHILIRSHLQFYATPRSIPFLFLSSILNAISHFSIFLFPFFFISNFALSHPFPCLPYLSPIHSNAHFVIDSYFKFKHLLCEIFSFTRNDLSIGIAVSLLWKNAPHSCKFHNFARYRTVYPFSAN